MTKQSPIQPSNFSKKFLEFNGKQMFFTLINGKWWIALKPICDALNVNWNRQWQNLKKDITLSTQYAVQHMQVGENQPRKMVCLPEFYIYGWLFQIQSESTELLNYKWECYEVLHDYFHGTITQRGNLLRRKAEAQEEIDKAIEEIPLVVEKQKEINRINRNLRELDKDILTGQFSLNI